jgi:hypothetical protein
MNNSIIVKGDILMKKYINDLILSLQKVGSKKEASMIKVLAQGYEALPGGLELDEELEWEYPDQEGIYDADSHPDNEKDFQNSKIYNYKEPMFNTYIIKGGKPHAVHKRYVTMDVIAGDIMNYDASAAAFVSDIPKKDRWVKDHKNDLDNIIQGYVVVADLDEYDSTDIDSSIEKKLFNFSNISKNKKETHLPGHRIEEDRITYDTSINIRGVGEFTGMNKLDDFTDPDFLVQLVPTYFYSSTKEDSIDEYDPDYDVDDDLREVPIGIDIENAIGGEYNIEDDEEPKYPGYDYYWDHDK